jgi:putative adenylate-forming enzyme
LVGQPSVLLAIAKSYQLADIKPTFNKIISVAEVLEDDHKEFFKSIFNCPINQVYQCTEGFLGYTCKKGQLHLNEDFLEIKKKYLDSNKTRFHPVITDYLRSSQPIVRYELNDILHEGPVCSCGSKSTVISKIEGRSDDIFRFLKNGDEIIIYPDFIRRAVILASDQILNYSVTLIDKKIISLYLDVEKTSELPEIFKSVKFEIEKLLSEFDIGDIDFIKANKKLDQLTKFTRIKNENSKSI